MTPAGGIVEAPTRIEPARLEEMPEEIADAIAALCSASAALGARLHPTTAANLSELVRLMNCYYSNLIEGHNTRPRDIARALAGELDDDEGRRNLQLEAAAHIRLQREVDRLAAEDRLPEPASRDFIRWLHREFYRGTSRGHAERGARPRPVSHGAGGVARGARARCRRGAPCPRRRAAR